MVYQATNALYLGTTGKARFWRDAEGRLRHPRQNGVNVDGFALGWKPEMRNSKHRYLWILGPRFERRLWRAILRFSPVPYPRG